MKAYRSYSLELLTKEKQRIEDDLKSKYERVMEINNDNDPRSMMLKDKMLIQVSELTKVIQQIEILNMMHN